ncbi:MAG: UbiA family prenyltransferase [Methanobacteriaceae archaeon]
MRDNILLTLLKSTRISWASKNVNMYLLALTYAYFANQPIDNPLQILGGLVLVSLFWGALYTLNDMTDLEIDRRDSFKKNRAFIQNKVDEKWIIMFVVFMLTTVFILSVAFMPVSFTLILILMLLNQIIYTLPPIRLKETALAPLSSTATNSVLRLASCAVLLGNILIVPPSVYLFMFIAGMGTYLMYKSKPRDASIVGALCGLVLIYIIYSGEMNLAQFLVALAPSIVAGIPLYLSVFTNQERMLKLADVLYHQVALGFFLICILIIIF